MSVGETIREYIFESPGVRTIFSAVIPIITGILSGTFVVEITVNGELDWRHFYKAHSFYVLVFLGLGIYWYNRFLYRHEKEVQRFLDSDYCIAYMRSKCLPEAAERYRELIRNGVGGELTQAMNELRRILR